LKTICTICARGGSKGVINKNIKELAGKPLIAWTIEQALKWGKADRVIVSTDSEEISKIAIAYGAEVPFIRPEHLAIDTAAKLPVIQHAVNYIEQESGTKYDYVVDLDPTSPLRNIEDIDDAYEALLENPEAENIYSVCRASKSPYFNMVEVNDHGYVSLSKELEQSIVRRQDAPVVFEMNASIYIFRRSYLKTAKSVHSLKTIIYEMPKERSIDIDSILDFQFVEVLMQNNKKKKEGKELHYKELFSLEGKVVVVTGSAGLLGKEMVRGLYEQGASVIAADITCPNPIEFPKELENEIYYTFLDITDKKSVELLVNSLGRIDVWVNNAYPRTTDWSAKFEDVPFESFQKNIDMHLNGYFLCCQVVAKKMKEQKEGVIINMASIYGLQGPNFNIYRGTEMTSPVAYAAIKGGIINLTRYLASYLGPYNIRVNAICPGGVLDNQPAEFIDAYEKELGHCWASAFFG